MNHQRKNKDVTVYLTMRNGNITKKYIFRHIKENHRDVYRRRLHIQVVNPLETFTTPGGFAHLVQKCADGGFVYVIETEISKEAMRIAINTGIPFGVLSRKNDVWTSKCINRITGVKTVIKTTVHTNT